MPRLRESLGGGPRLFIKRDDAIAFGFGGNKVRKLAFVARAGAGRGADTLITAGGVQSNHARATAAAAAKLGMRAVLVANGEPPERPTANALLDGLLGAEVVYVASREERAPKMREIAARLRADGRRPFAIPIGASTPLGALGFVLRDRSSWSTRCRRPTSSSTRRRRAARRPASSPAAGCSDCRRGWSASAPTSTSARCSRRCERDRRAASASCSTLDADATVAQGRAIEVDDRFVGDGYGMPTDASREAIELAARTEAIFLDPTYTAKAMAGLIAVRAAAAIRRPIRRWCSGTPADYQGSSHELRGTLHMDFSIEGRR